MAWWFTSSITKQLQPAAAGASDSSITKRVNGQLQLLQKLHDQAKTYDGVKNLLKKHPDCLSALVGLLSDRTTGLAARSAEVLRRIAAPDPTFAAKVINCDGAVEGLLVQLQTSNADVQLAAAGALAELAHGRTAWNVRGAQLRSIAAQQVEPGVIKSLTAMLSSSTAGVRCAAAGALRTMSEWSPANREQIGQFGYGQERSVITGLVILLSGNETQVQAAAARALAHLAWKTPANKQRIRLHFGVFTCLVALLSSREVSVQTAAAWALASLSLESAEDSRRIAQEPGSAAALEALMTSSNTQFTARSAAALTIAACAESSSLFRSILKRLSSRVWGQLDNAVLLYGHPYNPLPFPAELPRLLLSLVGCADGGDEEGVPLREFMVGSKELMLLLQSLARRYQGSMASEAIKLLTQGAGPTPATVTASVPSTSYGAQDTATTSDQTQQPLSGPGGKLAMTVELLKALESVTKMVPILSTNLSPFIKALAQFIGKVEQVRVNKAKAHSMQSRVDALMRFMTCMFTSRMQEALARNREQLAVLKEQLKRLEAALWKVDGLVAKWSKPMGLSVVVRFLQSDLDKGDIRDFESTVNKAVQDLNIVVSALNLVYTLKMQQQLQQLLSVARVSDSSLVQQLEQAHQQDLQQLQGQLEQLLGGQAELQRQLAAATEEQRQEWFKVAGHLGLLAEDVGLIREDVQVVREDVGVIRVDVRELADAVRAWMEGRTQAQASSSGQLVRSRLILDRQRVQWHDRDVLDSGGFADVYAGTFGKCPVAVKLLRLSSFTGEQQREQMYTEAAVLSRLNHPCIVRFWGVVPVEDSKAQRGVAEGASASACASRDSAGSSGSRAQTSGRSSVSSRLSVGLVMDRCDESLEVRLHAEPLLPLPKALHIAECIADGLNYLHTDAPLTVVHGDLKPANVLIKHATNEVLLTDFGLSSTIAVHTMSMGAQRLQIGQGAAGQATGCTLYWAAPELLQAWEDGHDAAHTLASDVYAFGLILYQLLVGKAPYAGMFKSEGALKGAVRRGVRPSWGGWEESRDGEVGPDVLSKLQALVEACWAQNADERPTAQVVHAQLVELQAHCLHSEGGHAQLRG